MKKRTLLPRLFLIGLASVPVIFYENFLESFKYYLPNNTYISFIKSQWHLVVLNILVFVAFLVPLSFRRKAKWGEYGLVAAFFVSLFVEMYGVPLSILFLYRHLDIEPIAARVNCLFKFKFFGVKTCLDHMMLFGGVLITIGTNLIIVAWVTLYRHHKESGLVTGGIYGYSRHPQYLGFLFVLIGWLFGWPSAITMIFVPILVFMYVRVCRTEEREVANQFTEYGEYRERVPFFL